MKIKNTKNLINKNKYDLDGIPPLKEALPLGLQHIFAMFLSNIAVPIIVASIAGISGKDLTILVQSAMVMAGVATIIQCYPIWKIGAGLPIVMGSSFGFFIKAVRKYFPKIVTGTVVLTRS